MLTPEQQQAVQEYQIQPLVEVCLSTLKNIEKLEATYAHMHIVLVSPEMRHVVKRSIDGQVREARRLMTMLENKRITAPEFRAFLDKHGRLERGPEW